MKHVPAAIVGGMLIAAAALRTVLISLEDARVDLAFSALFFVLAALVPPRPGRAGGLCLLLAPAFAGLVQLALGMTTARALTYQGAFHWATLAAVYWTATGNRWLVRHGLTVMLAFAALLAVTVMIPVSTQFSGVFPSRNNAASFFLFFLPVGLHAIANSTDRFWPVAAATLITAGLAATGSRAGAAIGILAFAAGAVVVLPQHRRFLAIPLAAGLACGGVVAARFSEVNPLGFRGSMLASTARMTADRPLAGWGLHAFEDVYPAYAAFDSGLLVNHAHNDWLEMASGIGVSGLAVFTLLLAASLKAARRRPWSIGLAAVLVHALVDYPFARMGVAVWFPTLLGMAEQER